MKTHGMTKEQPHTHAKKGHWMENAWPQGYQALAQLRQTAFASGEVDAKTNAVIQLACVSMLRCKHCVNNTVAMLKSEHQVSDRQIAEVMLVASYASAGTNLAWAKEVFEEHLGH
jgi:alkylhydroperoxidase/carboxymuconolactone decarboxylase family protein YurZ